jgi:molybdopterin converting factor subunit 1
MKILFFAQAEAITGCDHARLDIDREISVDELWEALLATFPALEALRRATRVARNGEYANSATRLDPADEIALIPPVSGG